MLFSFVPLKFQRDLNGIISSDNTPSCFISQHGHKDSWTMEGWSLTCICFGANFERGCQLRSVRDKHYKELFFQYEIYTFGGRLA